MGFCPLPRVTSDPGSPSSANRSSVRILAPECSLPAWRVRKPPMDVVARQTATQVREISAANHAALTRRRDSDGPWPRGALKSRSCSPVVALAPYDGGVALWSLATPNGGERGILGAHMKRVHDETEATQPATPSAALPSLEPESSPTVPGAAPAGPDEDPFGAGHRDPRQRYQVLGEHGRGGLGRVSRAHDRDLRRDVAIKELIARTNVNELRFMREALITARLEHPGIVPVHEAGRWDDGTPFYAMKLVAGRPLRELIAERTTVEARIGLLHHVIAVADAIAYAHDCNIIHRDLKPANVIIGDFGETIVIDWGLAKDLSTTDDAPTGGAPIGGNRHDDLTTTGGVLGTPAYMAPEQERGEHVDYRADVFAIGAMLWELCSVQRVPPTEMRQRHRMLRQAGIDRDLVTILDKALAQDPVRRYPNAGALAADLKAFKAGARIAARSYSLFALLQHWIRRHRAIALSIAATVVVATTGIVLFVHNVEIERDRADVKAEEALQQRALVESAKEQLLIQHAELLLKTDPTAAYQTLADYHGVDVQQAELLRSRATGLGVATFRLTPHTDEIEFSRGLPDGSIFTMGGGTIVKTSATGQPKIIAHGLTSEFTASFSAGRNLLAYSCDLGSICLLYVDSERAEASTHDMISFEPADIALSPGGHLLAAITARGELALWSIDEHASPTKAATVHVDGGVQLRFVSDHALAVATLHNVYVFDVGVHGTRLASRARIVQSDISDLTANKDGQLLAFSTRLGIVTIVDVRTTAIMSRPSLCRTSLNNIAFSSDNETIGYACQDGAAGVFNFKQGRQTFRTQIDGGAAVVASDPDRHYWGFGGNNGSVLIYDLHTGQLHRRIGHTKRIASIILPSDYNPHITSSDSNGTIVQWPQPSSSTRIAIESSNRLIAAITLPSNGALLASGSLAVSWSLLDGSSGTLEDHEPSHYYMAISSNTPNFAMYGVNDSIELWSFDSSPRKQLLRTQHGLVTAVRYFDRTSTFISAGRDGRVVEWSTDGTNHHELGSISEPISLLVAYPKSHAVVIQGTSGKLSSLVSSQVNPIDDIPRTSRLVGSPDGQWLAVGTTDGKVFIYDTNTWTRRMTLAFPSSIHDLAFSPNGRHLVVTDRSTIHSVRLPSPQGDLLVPSPLEILPWKTTQLLATNVSFSADGDWFAAACIDGMVWFYSIRHHMWIANPTSTSNVFFGTFSSDSHYFIATDAAHVRLTDMALLAEEANIH